MSTAERLQTFSVAYFSIGVIVVFVGGFVTPANGDFISMACFLGIVTLGAMFMLAGVRARGFANRAQ